MDALGNLTQLTDLYPRCGVRLLVRCRLNDTAEKLPVEWPVVVSGPNNVRPAILPFIEKSGCSTSKPLFDCTLMFPDFVFLSLSHCCTVVEFGGLVGWWILAPVLFVCVVTMYACVAPTLWTSIRQ
jgi:hypothetical protein